MILASHAPGEPHLFGWYLGLVIGFVVVLVVVAVVAPILVRAQRIGKQAKMAIDALDQSRQTTLPLWDVQKTNGNLRRILAAARAARSALGG